MKTPREVEAMILELAEAWESYAMSVTWLEGHPERCDLHNHTLTPHVRCSCGLRRVEAAIRALVSTEGITTKTTTRDSEANPNGA